ncbi:hypothetical protein Tco_1383576 [Tanacetum coccineum]
MQRKTQSWKETDSTFQVVLDALALTPCYSAFFITADVPEVYMHQLGFYPQICPRVHGQNFDELPTNEDIMSFFKELGHTKEINTITDIGMYYKKNVDYVELLWEDFTYQIDNRGHKKQDKVYYPQFTKVIIHHFLTKDKTISKRNKIGMHTSRDDYLINTLRFFSTKEESQIYGARLPKSMTSREMRETKAYKTYLGYAIGVTPPKKRVKRPAKKSSDAPIASIVIRETPVKSLSKKKEKMTIEKREGIDLLSEVALTEEAQHETDENESGFESNQDENEKEVEDDEEEKDEEFVKTLSNSTDDEDETNDESKIKDKAEGDEDEGMDYTTNQFDDDVDLRMNEPVTTDEGFIQKEGTDAEMINVQQRNENLEISQVIEDAHVTLFSVPQKTKVLVTSSSYSSDLVPSNQTPTLLTIPVSVITESSPVYSTVIPQSIPSFTPPPQQSTLTPPQITEATNPLYALPNFASIFQFDNRVTTLEKKLLNSKRQVKIQLPQILPKEVSNFTPPEIQRIVTESLEHAVLAKESSQPKSTYEATASLTKFELKKILINKMDESQLYLTAGEHRECYDGLIKSYDLDKSLFATYDKVSARGLKKRKTSTDAEPTQGPIIKELKFGSSKGGKSQSKSFGKSAHAEEPEFETPQQGPTQSWLLTLASSADKPSKTFDELMSTPIDFFAYIMNGLKITNLTQETLLGPAFKLLKGRRSNYAELEYDFEESLLFKRESKINVTKPETTRPCIRKKEPYTPYQDPHRFIYVDTQGRNRLMRSDELYMFSDGTLTRLRTSLDDITKNIRMEYLPQRRWSSLEKKRANIMIKAIDKLLKEKRMIRSLEKFVGGRHYGTDLRLLQRTI